MSDEQRRKDPKMGLPEGAGRFWPSLSRVLATVVKTTLAAGRFNLGQNQLSQTVKVTSSQAPTMFFEDLKEGQKFQTGGRTVTEADIVNFACLSGDFEAIHVNAEHAKKGPFGERIAHGLLGLAILSGLLHTIGIIRESVVAFVHLDWKFKSVVKIGDTIAGNFEVSQHRSMGSSQGLVSFKAQVTNQRQELVAEGLWELIIKKRPDNPHA